MLEGLVFNSSQWEDDPPPFDYLALGERATRRQGLTALEDATTLERLRQAHDAVWSGQGSEAQLLGAVEPILRVTSRALNLLSLPGLARQLDEQGAEVIEDARLQFRQVHEGAQRIRQFLESGDWDDLAFGFEQVETGFEALDLTQDEALSRLPAA